MSLHYTNMPNATMPSSQPISLGRIFVVIQLLLAVILSACSSGPLKPIDIGDSYDNYSPTLGERNVPITIVAYMDFTCKQCKEEAVSLRNILRDYPYQVRVVFRHFPLNNSEKALAAHRAANAAMRQGRFWDMHDMIFNNQHRLTDEIYVEFAKQLDMNTFQFMDDLIHPLNVYMINEDIKKAANDGIDVLPAIVLNGTILKGTQKESVIRTLIEQEMHRVGLQRKRSNIDRY